MLNQPLPHMLYGSVSLYPLTFAKGPKQNMFKSSRAAAGLPPGYNSTSRRSARERIPCGSLDSTSQYRQSPIAGVVALGTVASACCRTSTRASLLRHKTPCLVLQWSSNEIRGRGRENCQRTFLRSRPDAWVPNSRCSNAADPLTRKIDQSI
jgi:hypothetical protein